MSFLSNPPESPPIITAAMLRDELVARLGDDPPDELRGSTALLALTRRDLRVALQLAPSRTRSAWPVATAELHLCRLPESAGRPFALVGPAVGAPVAAIILELLAVLGATRVVAVGACGSLQPDLRIGATILPTTALREEGTSHHYLPADATVRPAPDLLDTLATAATAAGLAPRRGPVWTTDALFRETRSKVQRYQAAGVLGVDMETATLFAVGQHVGLAVAALLVVSDELGELTWRPGFRAAAFHETHERTVQAALAVCAR